jgi:hypothetical protein
MSDLERIARLEARADLQDRLLLETRDDVKHIRSILDQSRGGIKMAIALASIAGAIGGIIGWVVSHIKFL